MIMPGIGVLAGKHNFIIKWKAKNMTMHIFISSKSVNYYFMTIPVLTIPRY